MNESELRNLLHEVPVPDAAAAERRGLEVIERAFAARGPSDRPVLPRLALALAAVTLLAGLLLSPAGAAVRSWIDDAFTAGVPNAEPALSDLPGGGRLLVQSSEGPWVVQPDGSRRLLGSYGSAAWSPHGLFVAAAADRMLSALEPDGTPRWSITAAATVSDPRWAPSGYRVAYRAAGELRVVNADGTEDRLVDHDVAAVPAAWFPLGLHLLAYLDGEGRLRLADPDGATRMGSASAASGTVELAWSPDASLLLERTPRALWLHGVHSDKLLSRIDLDAARRVRTPSGAKLLGAAFSPRSNTIAALLRRPAVAGESRSEVRLIDPGDSSQRRLFAVSGELSDLAWSPDGSHLLLAWSDADQWLFLPLDGKDRIRAIEGIASIFSPGSAGRAPFPQVEGWCCSAR